MTMSEPLTEAYGIRGYPTFKIFGIDKTKPYDYRGKFSLRLEVMLTYCFQVIEAPKDSVKRSLLKSRQLFLTAFISISL